MKHYLAPIETVFEYISLWAWRPDNVTWELMGGFSVRTACTERVYITPHVLVIFGVLGCFGLFSVFWVLIIVLIRIGTTRNNPNLIQILIPAVPSDYILWAILYGFPLPGLIHVVFFKGTMDHQTLPITIACKHGMRVLCIRTGSLTCPLQKSEISSFPWQTCSQCAVVSKPKCMHASQGPMRWCAIASEEEGLFGIALSSMTWSLHVHSWNPFM